MDFNLYDQYYVTATSVQNRVNIRAGTLLFLYVLLVEWLLWLYVHRSTIIVKSVNKHSRYHIIVSLVISLFVNKFYEKTDFLKLFNNFYSFADAIGRFFKNIRNIIQTDVQ